MINLSASQFFLPTKKFRKLSILLVINSIKGLSQHGIADQAGLSSAMVNGYIKDFIRDDCLEVVEINRRDREYLLTPKGEKLLMDALMACSAEIIQLYSQAEAEISRKMETFFADRKKMQVVLFGGSQTARFVLNIIEQFPQIFVTAIVDNDQEKWGQVIGRHVIQSPDILLHMNFQCVIVASFAKQNEIAEALKPFRDQGVRILKLTTGC